jgi:hypothetical protein
LLKRPLNEKWFIKPHVAFEPRGVRESNHGTA